MLGAHTGLGMAPVTTSQTRTSNNLYGFGNSEGLVQMLIKKKKQSPV